MSHSGESDVTGRTYETGDIVDEGDEGDDGDDGFEGIKLTVVVSRFGVRYPGIKGRGRRIRPMSNFFKGGGGEPAENNKLKQPSRM